MFGLMPWRRERPTEALLPEARPLGLMRRELDTLFDRFFGLWPLDLPEGTEFPPTWGLKVEEKEKEVVVRAEAPGFEPAELDVTILGDVLTIIAMHKPAKKEGKEVEVKEERVAEMKRYVTLPPGVDLARIEAFYRNGVLEIHLPRTAEALGRRIEIKT